MADSERALGRLDRALDLTNSPEGRSADRATQIELRIVESGIRRDQGLAEAAVAALQLPEITDGRIRPGSARLFYAYADALLDAGREDEAREWFRKAAIADTGGDTDAADRFEELDQIFIEDLEDLQDDGGDLADREDGDALADREDGDALADREDRDALADRPDDGLDEASR